MERRTVASRALDVLETATTDARVTSAAGTVPLASVSLAPSSVPSRPSPSGPRSARSRDAPCGRRRSGDAGDGKTVGLREPVGGRGKERSFRLPYAVVSNGGNRTARAGGRPHCGTVSPGGEAEEARGRR